MDYSYQVPIDTQNLFIASPGQHDHLLEWFKQGIQLLECQLGTDRYAMSDVSAIINGLLGIAKAITHFLRLLTSLQAPEVGSKLQYKQHLKTIWLRQTITTVTAYCHRYSLVVLRLAREREMRTFEPPLEVSEIDLPSNTSTQTSISSWDSLTASGVLDILEISELAL